MYKRILACVLLAALLLTGCQSTPDAYDPATDSQRLTLESFGPYVVESDLGYYISTGSFIQFVDRETMQPIVLCAKPNCLHNQEPDLLKWQLCDGFFLDRGFSTPIYYMDDHLYVLAFDDLYFSGSENVGEGEQGFRLIRLNPDGTGRRELFSLPRSVNGDISCLHRGVFYYADQSFTEDGVGGAGVYARPVDAKNGESERIFHVPSNNRISHNQLIGLGAYGDRLYVQEYVSEDNTIQHTIDLNTREVTTIETPAGMNTVMKALILQEELILHCSTQMPFGASTKAAYYRCPLDGSREPELVYDALPGGDAYTDGEYIYQITYRDDPQWIMLPDKLHILNREWQEVCTYELSGLREGSLTGMVSVRPTCGGTVLLEVTFAREGQAYFAFSQDEIQSGVIQPRECFRYREREYSLVTQ